MKIKSVVLVLLLSLALTACGDKKEETVESVEAVSTEEETVEVIEEVVTTVEETSQVVEESEGFVKPETAYGEEKGFEFTTDTSFNFPWLFSFSNEQYNQPQEFPGISVNQYDAATEFKSVKYKDEGDLRIVDVVLEHSGKYQLMHQFGSGAGQFWYVYCFTGTTVGDIYTGTRFASENTSDETNYYDLTTTLEIDGQKVDVQVKKVEDSELFRDIWMMWDENSEARDCNVVKRYNYQFTYPKDYDGVIFGFLKNGAPEIQWDYLEEKVYAAGSLDSDYSTEEMVYVKLNDLINIMGEETDNVMTIEGKLEEIKVREEEKERAAAEAEAKAQAEAEARAAALLEELGGQTVGEWMQENGIEMIDGSTLE